MSILTINALAIAAMMLLVWLLSLALKDVSIVDVFWGLGFVMIGWLTFFQQPTEQGPTAQTAAWLIPILVTVWGLRLSGYLFWRNHGKPEDPRYAAMRQKHGGRFWLISLLTVFVLQGVVMWVVSLPIQLVKQEASGMSLLVGLAVFAVGLYFEAVGDWQLAVFRADSANSGKVLDRGLWRLTRHPNYFGDFCVWWGLSILAIFGGAPIWSVVGPILMSTTLLRWSGVTLLERSLQKSKPGYDTYIQRTNAFFPWPPRPQVATSESPDSSHA